MDKEIISVKRRKQLLRQLKQMLIEHEAAFLQALKEDLGKPEMEGYASEIAVLLNEIDYTLKRLDRWVRPRKTYELKIGYIAQIIKRPVPYGNVLVISPWNYPLQLALLPAVNAIAAGNSCVIKPSEYAPATSELLKKCIRKHVGGKEISVLTGDAIVAQELIAHGFDLIIFTGSAKVGKKVCEQAAANLTPVIMELGGKNACILDESALTEETIREIVWGKFLNAGQTCIAPDTLFVPEPIFGKAVAMVKNVLSDFYQENEWADFGRLVNDAYFRRVQSFLSQGSIAHGGKVDASRKFISPTVLVDMDQSSDVMKEEIFGPVLPIVPYGDMDRLLASDLIQKDALTTYLFTRKKEQIHLLRQKVKGMVSVNKVIHHGGSSRVPFGGIGSSGFGAYHGQTGFTACSHLQTNYRAFTYQTMSGKYPPYSEQAFAWVKRLRKWLF